MSLSHERLVHLSHRFLESLREHPGVEFRAEAADIRLQIVRTLKRELEAGERIEAEVRRRIESQRRSIPEGSPEWEVLFRQYYDEAYRKEFGPRR